MKRRITRVAATAVVLAVLVLGLPLAVAIDRLVVEGEHGELERAALRAASAVSPAYLEGDPIELRPAPGDMEVGVYDLTGHRVAGAGPATATVDVAQARTGATFRGRRAGAMFDVVPVLQGERTIAAVRAATPTGGILLRTALWWAALAAGCLLAVGAAVLVASRQSQQLAQPLVELAAAARRLGDGDFSVRPGGSDVAEIQAAAAALARTAGRLRALVERERAFTARASHQLRTPLSQLQLELERGEGDVPESNAAALAIVEQLSTTIDDVLQTARPAVDLPPLDVADLLEQMRQDWHGTFAAADRPLRVRLEGRGIASASASTLRQVLHVLLDNALAHGEGAVTLRLRDAHEAVAVDVEDEGHAARILRDGLGLSMARSLVESEGGRIARGSEGPTRFTVLLVSSG